MNGKMISIDAPGGGSFQAYLSVPRPGVGPGILLLQEIFGVNDYIRRIADEYADEGYVVIAPDLFWRLEPGLQLGYDDAGVKQAREYNQRFDVDQGVRDAGTVLDALRARPELRGKVAALGYCLGGRLAMLAAARLDVDAAISYYGVNLEAHLGEAPVVKCPILFHFPENDRYADANVREKVRAAFAAHDYFDFFVYRGADHAFSNPDRPAYDRISAQIARSRTIGMLRQWLGPRYDLNALWERHGDYEFAIRDADATIATMVAEPYVNHIPTLTGGIGRRELHRFYKYHFIPTLPKDTKLRPVSRTIGADSVVDELLFCCTHTEEIDWLLPGIAPTGKYLEIPTVVIIQFRGDQIAHEHIYWDSASALVQVGALDPRGLPTTGIETARKALNEKSSASNLLMARWSESEGKE
jgi:carboxymethylenebutenolidase